MAMLPYLLIMEHCGAEYVGAVLLSHPAFSRLIFRLLVRSSSKTIREIGEIDLTQIALRGNAEMRIGEDKFKLIADENDKLRHELRNHVTMMRFLRDSIREQIEARTANSQKAGWTHFEPRQATRNIDKTL